MDHKPNYLTVLSGTVGAGRSGGGGEAASGFPVALQGYARDERHSLAAAGFRKTRNPPAVTELHKENIQRCAICVNFKRKFVS